MTPNHPYPPIQTTNWREAEITSFVYVVFVVQISPNRLWKARLQGGFGCGARAGARALRPKAAHCPSQEGHREQLAPDASQGLPGRPWARRAKGTINLVGLYFPLGVPLQPLSFADLAGEDAQGISPPPVESCLTAVWEV